MLERLEHILQQDCRLKSGYPIIVGVSGGPDSLCLLDVLHCAGYPLIVAHFNHKLRPEADEEAASVGHAAEKLGLPFFTESTDVRAYAAKGSLSIEEAARMLRYRFLFTQAREHGAQAVAVGHTADDQVETVLMHFLRGAGLAGLKGMTYRAVISVWDTEIPLVRPLLDVWHAETLAYCTSHDLHPHFDPSNLTPDFFRSRLRHHLIPILETYNPRLRETIWRTAKAMAGDHAILSEFLDSAWQMCVDQETFGYITFDAPLLSQFAPGLQRNLIRRALERIHPAVRDVSFAILERAVAFIADPNRSLQTDLVGGVRLFREAGQLYVVTREAELPFDAWPQIKTASLPVPLPGQLEISGGWQLESEAQEITTLAWEQARQNEDPFQVWLDAERLTGTLELRSRQPGDRFRPLGMEGHSLKLSDFFVNVKLPCRARRNWPLLCMGEDIVWVPGYRPAHPFCLTESTRRVVHFVLRHNER